MESLVLIPFPLLLVAEVFLVRPTSYTNLVDSGGFGAITPVFYEILYNIVFACSSIKTM